VIESESCKRGEHYIIRCEPQCCNEVCCMHCDFVSWCVTDDELIRELKEAGVEDVAKVLGRLHFWRAHQ
jgi:hypothetical protein